MFPKILYGFKVLRVMRQHTNKGLPTYLPKGYNAFFLFFLNNIHSYNKYIHIGSYINKKNQKKKLSSIVLKTYRLTL